MDLSDKLQDFRKSSSAYLDHIKSEEQTKVSLVLPMLRLLGYDTTNPSQVITEFVADIGEKKGEKVDMAIMSAGKPVILIEVKQYGDTLSAHDVQLMRYFQSTPAKFAVLTDGIRYKFFSDIEEPNKMDRQPFFEFHLMEADELQINEFGRFQKDVFVVEEAAAAAIELRYSRRIKQRLDNELRDPSEAFLRFWLSDICSSKLTKKVLTDYGPVVKQALNEYISERVSDHLRSAMESVERPKPLAGADHEKSAAMSDGEGSTAIDIVNIPKEVEAFLVLRAVLARKVAPERLSYYMSRNRGMTVRLDGNIKKWICRLSMRKEGMLVMLNSEPSKEYEIANASALFGIEARLVETVGVVDKRNSRLDTGDGNIRIGRG